MHKVNKFWFTYFLIRLFYLLFTILIYNKFTNIGDTFRYLAGSVSFTPNIFINSTNLMDFTGGILGTILGRSGILPNIPFTLLSFYTIKWAIEKLEYRKYINKYILLTIISLPNFCIWTSVCSKETIGLAFSSILGVLLVNYLKGDYKIRERDFFAFYLCLLFKPQYLPFILQGLVCIYWMQKYCKKAISQFLFGLFIISMNVIVLYLISDIVNQYAEMIPIHFTSYDGSSNRNENIWIHENDFFIKAPIGMFTVFFGPTLNEMLSKPTHLIAGIESTFMLILFIYLCWKTISHFYYTSRFNATIIPTYFIIFSGICLLHYPFGIFNPGSAIRYRTNFIFLFIILLMYLYARYKKQT